MTVTKIKKKLTKRDKNIILYVYERIWVTKKQIYEVFFSHQQSGQAICRRVVNRLTTYDYLYYKNKFYAVGQNGRKIVSENLQEKHGIIKLKIYTTPNEHLNEVNNFRNSLLLACRNNNTLLLNNFISYYNHREELKDRAIFIHVPDAVFLLQKNQKHFLLFLEIDRMTEGNNQYTRMLRWYLEYFSGGLFRLKYGSHFNTAICMIVVPSQVRLNHMRKEATQLIEKRQIELLNHYKNIDIMKHYLKYLWITTKDNIKPELIFSKVWRSLNEGDNTLYGVT